MPPLRPPPPGRTRRRFLAGLLAATLLASVVPGGTAAVVVEADDGVGSDRSAATAADSQAWIGPGPSLAIDPLDQIDPDDDAEEESGDDDRDDEEGDGDGDDEGGNDGDDGENEERGNADHDSAAAGPPFGEGPLDGTGVGDLVGSVLTEVAGSPEDDRSGDDGEAPPDDRPGRDGEAPPEFGESGGSGADGGDDDTSGDGTSGESGLVGGYEVSGLPASDGDGTDGAPASQVAEPTPTESPAPAVLRVSDVSTNRSVVAEGEPVRLTATVVNDGDVTGSADLRLYLFGEVVDARSVTVPGEDAREVSFDRTIAAPGTYEATVGDASTTVTVEPRHSTTTDAGPDSQATPGFTALAALLGVLVVVLFVRLRE